ncbi:glycoside hydrolase family 3 protein [Companilactobacillus futsaii]|uniref:Glycoside hydrolase family 3 n=2 Tax=Companilactobacillus futsaii TaxID=938155 RepID=A0A5B7T478_9LACO|nr:glycoside hydrolase family 3 protein [Companilactobacillus futsaii]KRK95247.1 glycoside hydrolase family 3 domain protein [Companilactobacillus futsaii JCM 17355]QCX25162.1 glycoside hydrolase family 3 [Companilactobacillus futsaii]
MENISQRELENQELAKDAAQEAIVLLQNKNQTLPLKNKNIALYGHGAFATVKGGTGSGDVNQRSVVSILQGLENAGFTVTTKSWLMRLQRFYQQQKHEHDEKLKDNPMAILAPGFTFKDPEIAEFEDAATGIYVISRVSGENYDRRNRKGDFKLTDNELSNIIQMSQFYSNSIVLLNVGGVMDTSFIDQCPMLDSVVLVSQLGMTTGDAVAEILDGTKTPSGKLTDTWAYNYEDYPSSENFGMSNPEYVEGIYVGYRYFDSFQIKPRFEFGFGQSYAKFFLKTQKVNVNEERIRLQVAIENSSEKFSGQETVQVYVSKPQSDIPTPYQDLVAYQKTTSLRPNARQTLEFTVPMSDLSIFDSELGAYVLMPGTYYLRVGNSSKNTQVVATFKLDEKVILEKVDNLLVPRIDPTTLTTNKVSLKNVSGVPFFLLKATNFSETKFVHYQEKNDVTTFVEKREDLPGKSLNQIIEHVRNAAGKTLDDVSNGDVELAEFVASLTDQELIDLVEGQMSANKNGVVGISSDLVPGAAGQTGTIKNKRIPAIVMADGPAGVRVEPVYKRNDQVIEHFATAWPIGTALAQTWNKDLIEKVGFAVGTELKEFGVDLWLAPGMNIHRDPLGGRNFEYFSEDPYLSGTMAAFETKGVQTHHGIGVTIKHFFGNNQESHRNYGNSVISEQALRQIYLRNFEIAIKTCAPVSIMTSYNRVNGIFSGANFELLTNVLRDEWHFEGLVMTDWFSSADPKQSMHAGNDLIMPGSSKSELMSAVTDFGPEFDEQGNLLIKHGYDFLKKRNTETEMWNDFIVDNEGEVLVKLRVSDDSNLKDRLKDWVYDGVAQITDKNHVLLSGKWKDNNDLYLGDLQKSAINVLRAVLKLKF